MELKSPQEMGVQSPRKFAPMAATMMALLGLFASFLVVANQMRHFVVPVITVEVALIALAIFQWSVFLTRYIAFEIDSRVYAFGVKADAQRERDLKASRGSGNSPT